MTELLMLTLFLLLCSAFFSGSETALFSLSRLQILRLKAKDSPSSKSVVKLLKNPRSLLITILLGNEFTNVAISIAGAAIIARLMHTSPELETILAVLTITPVVLIFGEIFPKTIAIKYAWNLIPMIIHPLVFFHRMVTPMRRALLSFSDRIIRFAGGSPEASSPLIMEEEYKRLIDQGIKYGAVVEEERKLIHNVFDFSDKTAEKIMTPRNEIFSISISESYEEIIKKISSRNLSRIPIYEGSDDNIIGILHRKDLFLYQLGHGEDRNFAKILRQPLFVSKDERLDKLLHIFQTTQQHIAVVKENDAVKGLVTLSDVLEEIFGKMGDSK